ncbi:DEAD/DEAH box helicase [Pseudomonas sp. EMN2]|uniref:DEAD/DEAH box helicase n=1 Tax=Pseudomonas sp. EMN2 TaxID=2615212 RepID=UPI00129B265F|nr:DEAD/DEAH box helicase [Pseudomonas sp. EMN2]
MNNLPASVKFLDSAASSAAKARGAKPSLPTTDPYDVATALKCITAFQVRVDLDALESLDDETAARPLTAAARILQSTAQHLRRMSDPPDDSELDDLSFHAALAYAMYGNFPSARAALRDVSTSFLRRSLVFRMVAAFCDPAGKLRRSKGNERFEVFRYAWLWALRSPSKRRRAKWFEAALSYFAKAAVQGSMAEGALLMGGRVAAYQAMRLATINLLEDAPEIPDWFVRNSIKSGTVTLLPPQHILLVKRRVANNRRNSLLTLPTSTGKTFVAEACMAANFEDGGLCVYVAPYVAVGEQVKDSLQNRLGVNIPFVSMFGGFRTDKLNGASASEAVVATPERFDGWLRLGKDIERLRTVIFDEIHILENGVRGARVEGIISRLLLLQQSYPKIRIIGLSAVLTEPAKMCDWLRVKQRDLHQIAWRPTARRLAMCLANGDMYWIHGYDALRPSDETPTEKLSKPVKINLPGVIRPARFPNANEKSAAANLGSIAKDLLIRLGPPGLIVCARKIDTRLLAYQIAADRDIVEDDEVSEIADGIVLRYPYLTHLADCLRHGVAYHNASLPFDVRRKVEMLVRARQLSVVCATTTLAEGADLPFRWTIVGHWLSSMREDGTAMKSMTFRNIAGRCGRAGAFAEGDTILFENLMGPPSLRPALRSTKRMEEVMFSSTPIESTLGGEWDELPDRGKQILEATLSSQLLACISENPETDDVVSDFAEATYAGHTDGGDNVRRILSEAVDRILDSQQSGGAMAVRNSPIRLTEFGKAANLSGFSPDTCRLMVEYLQQLQHDVGAKFYSELLREFHNLPEQSNEALKKIYSGAKHRNVVKEDNVEVMIEKLLSDMDLRDVFESLRKKTSKASPESVETYFEDFVSFINSVFGSFLPWLLRGLEKLSVFGSEEAVGIMWSQMAKEIESVLRARGDEDEVEDPFLPVE